MTRSAKRWFEVAAFAITITALLAIATLAMRLFLARPHSAKGLAISISMFSAFIGVFVVGIAIAVKRRQPPGDSARMSIKDELDLRKLRAKGTRTQFR